MKNRILIIGGSGFVGTYLIDQLSSYDVLNFDKNKSPFYQKLTNIGNILDKSLLSKSFKNVKTVILLAAEHRDDVKPVSLYYDVNVNGTRNVLQLMKENNICNLIFTSSVAVYGLNKNNPDEEHPLEPFNHYGKSKLLAENEIKKWYNDDKSNKCVTIIRPTVIFGERNRGNVYNLLRQICIGNFIMVGNGNNKKSMAYIKNIVAFIIFVVNNKKKGLNIYNYADKPDLNMNELVKLIQTKMNLSNSNFKIPFVIGILFGYLIDFFAFIFRKKTRISSVRIRKFCASTQFNSSKIDQFFKRPYSLEHGINSTIENEFLNKKNDEIVFYSE